MKNSSRQRGYALLVFVALLLTAASAVTVKALNRSSENSQIARDRITAAALAQAKEALIGYAITYRDNHSNEVWGYLPLPDLGSSRNGTPQEGNSSANFSGNSKNLSVIGRLPWRTLDLQPLRDGQGECLWYAVSGSFQNTQKADALNWDSLGHFDVYSSNGTSSGTTSMTGANYTQRPVAIIFSAGAVLTGQSRATSATDNVTTCGGNYDAHNYLDSYSTNSNINNIINYFAGSSNNSTAYAYNLSSTSNGSLLGAADLAAPKNIIFGDTDVSGSKIVNDRMLTITADEIFHAIIKRNDFSGQIAALLDDPVFVAYLQQPSLVVAGNKGTDNLDCGTGATGNTSTAANKNFCDNWKEMLLLTKLPASAAITIDGAATPNCSRVLIFGGKKTGTQARLTTTNKSNPANYLEGANLSSFATPTATNNNFNGASTFVVSNPSADLMRCIP